MAYVNYNRALYRTGFRPYGQANPWAASQLNGYSVSEAVLSGYLGQSHPFTDAGGWRLHGLDGSASFHPWTLHGLGNAICLGPDENTVACADPTCTYGDCGSTDTQQVGGPLCLDQKENAISCASPECTYGDCFAPRPKGLLPGPSPRVTAPVNLVPSTAPSAALPSSLMASTIIKGIPDLFLYGGAFLLAASFLSPPAGGRRR